MHTAFASLCQPLPVGAHPALWLCRTLWCVGKGRHVRTDSGKPRTTRKPPSGPRQ